MWGNIIAVIGIAGSLVGGFLLIAFNQPKAWGRMVTALLHVGTAIKVVGILGLGACAGAYLMFAAPSHATETIGYLAAASVALVAILGAGAFVDWLAGRPGR